MKAVEAYPLQWPVGRPRTSTWSRERANFETTFARSRDDIVREVALLKGTSVRWINAGTDVVISTNVALRRDGLPLASQRAPDDPGVAVYFDHKKRPMCFACDRWNKIEDNMRAIVKTIEALRGIARWGTGDMLEAAFTGFAALPAPTPSNWRAALEFPAGYVPDLGTLMARWKGLRSISHPDRQGGNAARFDAVNKAYEEAKQELGYV